MQQRPDLPIDDVLGPLMAALKSDGRAVLQAPPGAGKTTRVPLEMVAAGLTEGVILILEPRRLAARAAAQRMAETLGEPVGRTVGYRMRGETRVSGATRIEVVTEAILTRRMQNDPGLDGVGAVIFDEFHERSIHADLGLALCLEIQSALRPDLILLVMSATLEATPVAALMGDAPVITSEGRIFPVETRYSAATVAGRSAVRNGDGRADRAGGGGDHGIDTGLSAGCGRDTARRGPAAQALPKGIAVRPLYGAMDLKAQRQAIAPSDDPKSCAGNSDCRNLAHHRGDFLRG